MWVVYVRDPEDNIERVITEDRQSDIGAYIVSANENQVANNFRHNPTGTSVCLAGTEETAVAMGNFLARNRPGKEVFLAEVKDIITTEMPKTIRKKVTTQGVLPE